MSFLRAPLPTVKPRTISNRLSSIRTHLSPIFTQSQTARMPQKTQWDPSATPYPKAKRLDHVDVYKSQNRGEVKIEDPYRWLEVPPSESKETEQFVKEQSEFTRKYLDKNGDLGKFKDALRENWNFPRFSCPSLKEDDYYYFNYNSGLQSQSPIYRVKKGKEREVDLNGPGGELFFDPNLLSKDGTVALSAAAFSKSGDYFAYGISRSGSDWVTINVRPSTAPHVPSQTTEKDEGKLERDVVKFVKFSGISWWGDKGFFYQRFPDQVEGKPDVQAEGAAAEGDHDKLGTGTDKDLNAKLYYHPLNSTPSSDPVILHIPESPTFMYGASVTDDDRYLVVYISKDTGKNNLLWVADLKDWDGKSGEGLKWSKLVEEWGDYYSFIANDGPKFYIHTNKDKAMRNKVVIYDLEDPSKGFVDHIPEDEEAVLSETHVTNKDKLVLLYSRDVKDELHLYDLKSGKSIERIAADVIGTVGQIAGKREHDEFWVSFSGYTSPGSVYRYEFGKPEGQRLSVYRATNVAGLHPDDFISEQVFYKSKDGTRVPMFVTRPKTVKLDGTAPVLQYGYGGFAITIAPFFSPGMMTFIKHYNAILAVPSIRGGNEYGEDWHLAGCFGRKQNVFDDFIYASRYLIDNKYTSEGRIAISGGSNGGLLVGACANQAPALFGAAIADVGVLDMLRFQEFTIGRAWTADYGSSEDPEGFDYLIAYSPLHNVRPKVTYPALMLLTADHDDRVVPLHSFKHIAELQYRRPENENPLLLRVDLKSGHGAGKSTEKRIDEAADKFGFVAQSMGLSWRE